MAAVLSPGKPIDVATRETLTFLCSYLDAGSQIIEVGCGDGEVALELIHQGYEVTALDSEEERIGKAQSRGVPALVARWPEFNGSPVDAIAFTRSLHHINPLDRALKKARELIKSGGVLLIEDFAFGETDERTVRWLFESVRSDQGRSHIMPVEGQFVTELVSAKDPAKAWHESHDRALHSISTLVSAISDQFVIREAKSVPYLYRYFIPVLPETGEARVFVERLLNEETRLGNERSIALMGRRIVATPK
jgi:ubiquinone/menaquinone biosynthesis C-methylase UbiE